MDSCGCDRTRRGAVSGGPLRQPGAGGTALVVATADGSGGAGGGDAFALDGESRAGVRSSSVGGQPAATAADLWWGQQTRPTGRAEAGASGAGGLAAAEAGGAPAGAGAGGPGANRGAGSAGGDAHQGGEPGAGDGEVGRWTDWRLRTGGVSRSSQG